MPTMKYLTVDPNQRDDALDLFAGTAKVVGPHPDAIRQELHDEYDTLLTLWATSRSVGEARFFAQLLTTTWLTLGMVRWTHAKQALSATFSNISPRLRRAASSKLHELEEEAYAHGDWNWACSTLIEWLDEQLAG